MHRRKKSKVERGLLTTNGGSTYRQVANNLQMNPRGMKSDEIYGTSPPKFSVK